MIWWNASTQRRKERDVCDGDRNNLDVEAKVCSASAFAANPNTLSHPYMHVSAPRCFPRLAAVYERDLVPAERDAHGEQAVSRVQRSRDPDRNGEVWGRGKPTASTANRRRWRTWCWHLGGAGP